MTDDMDRGADELELAKTEQPAEADGAKSAPTDRASKGPFDLTEVPTIKPYIDFGGLKIAPREGLQLRLEVDQRAKRVVAVTIDYQESLLQVQGFSAPKSSGLWHRVRGEISQQFQSQGARVEEQDGALGPELAVVTKVPEEQGGGLRLMRFIAVDGPRWMLRGVVMGKAAENEEARGKLIDVFRDIVVVRGEQPMPPSELLPLQVPAGVGKNPAQGTAPTQGAPGA